MVQDVDPQMICLKGHAAPNKAIDGDSASYFAGDHDVGVLTVKFWLGIKLFYMHEIDLDDVDSANCHDGELFVNNSKICLPRHELPLLGI